LTSSARGLSYKKRLYKELTLKWDLTLTMGLLQPVALNPEQRKGKEKIIAQNWQTLS